jgi:FkbM family methyltransferase
MLENNRPNNYLFNNLVSCIQEEVKFRYFCYGHAAVSGVENTLTQMHFDEFYNHPSNQELQQDTMMIKPKTLTEIVNSTPLKHIDLLSLDVEGHEYEVLQSWDFSVPIDVILIEMLGVEAEKEELCRQILYKNGYRLDRSFAHNEIFVLVPKDDV